MLDERQEKSAEGGQYDFIGVDEITQLWEGAKTTLEMRIRGGIVPGIFRATCNPVKNSWVRKDLEWFLDKDGYPIDERSGIIRWWIRCEKTDAKIWFASCEDAEDFWRWLYPQRFKDAQNGKGSIIIPLSFTFINSKATDNVIMATKDPRYTGKLDNAPKVVRDAKRDGCWNFQDGFKLHFDGDWIGPPVGWKRTGNYYYDENGNHIDTIVDSYRGYDFAYSAKTEKNNPDSTSTIRIDRLESKRFIVADHEAHQLGSLGIKPMIQRLALMDPQGTQISIPQDPGGGQGFSDSLISELPHLNIEASREIAAPRDSDLTAKEYRFLPFAAQCKAGQVLMLKSNVDAGDGYTDWNERVIYQWEALGSEDSKKIKKDDADSMSRAYKHATRKYEQEFDPFEDL